jgi:hypothetical protein
MKFLRQGLLLVIGHALRFASLTHAETVDTHRLALLIAAPWEDQAAMHHDVTVMTETLLSRHFSPQEILTLEGPLDRQKLITFLHAAHSRIGTWPDGALFLYISGHGGFTGTTVSSARPALMLASSLPDDAEHWVFWDEVFSALGAPDNVQIILLPDT